MRSFVPAVFAVLFLVACSSQDPGPLAGTWQLQNGPVIFTINFRRGETESLGRIDQVSYDVHGDKVSVTLEDGAMKGTAVAYAMTGPDSAQSAFGILRRIR